MKRKTFEWIVALGAVALGTGTARAEAVLDFQLGGSGGGTISWAGGTAPLVGSSIPVGLVSATGTPLNDLQTLNITGSCGGRGCLNFTSGALTSNALGVLTFAPGTSFTITGGISALGLGNTTVLESSSAANLSIEKLGPSFSFTEVFGSDTENSSLVTHFFGSTKVAGWDMAGSLLGGGISNISKAFSIHPLTSVDISDAASLPITNSPIPPVPEPMSVVLLGTSMVGIATVISRRKKVQNA